jgi:hypothetical protein
MFGWGLIDGVLFRVFSNLEPDAGKRGRQFEHFVKWFLKNDPEWATQVNEV